LIVFRLPTVVCTLSALADMLRAACTGFSRRFIAAAELRCLAGFNFSVQFFLRNFFCAFLRPAKLFIFTVRAHTLATAAKHRRPAATPGGSRRHSPLPGAPYQRRKHYNIAVRSAPCQQQGAAVAPAESPVGLLQNSLLCGKGI